MTKYEQAIKYFEEQLKVLDDHWKRGGEFAAEALEHTKTAIEALRKQMPRALHKLDGDYGECRSCKAYNDKYDNYCMDCGQAIDTRLTECINYGCADCGLHKVDGPVCKHYADKVDEIRRIHEEG